MAEKIMIPLSKKQRDLLLKYEPFFADMQLFKMISIAVKKGDTYEICLTEEQIENLLDQVAELSNSEKNETMQDKLDDLGDYLEEFSDVFGEDEQDEEEDYSKYSNNTGAVCILKVALAKSKIWRKIAIRGGQTLHKLHDMIFEAFDREDEHMYSFFVPSSPVKFNPRKIYHASVEYTHPYAYENQGPFSKEEENAAQTTIESLNLREGQVFYYLFDFGDDWWHEITVEKADGTADDGEYPRIIERKGDSPEQYQYDDEDE